MTFQFKNTHETEISVQRKFANPHEEIAYLRTKVAEQEQSLREEGRAAERREIAKEHVSAYQKTPAEQILASDYQIKAHEIENVISIGKEHEEVIDELVRVMMERGVKNTLTLLEKLNNPHLEDDFHRFLVQFLLDEKMAQGFAKEHVLFRALRMRLYEITLPPIDGATGEKREFAQLVAGMEQFYAGMLSIEGRSAGWRDVKNYFTLELALSNFSSEIVFYAAVPTERADLFEKQVFAVYPDAKLREHKEDYNPFNESGATLVSVAEPSGNSVFAMKTSEAFPQDPLSVLLGAFGKMKHEGEGAAVQFVIEPTGRAFNERYKGVRDEIKKGAKMKEALKGVSMRFASDFAKVTKELVFGAKKKEEEVDQESVENITEKISAPIVDTNIRIVVSAETEARAESILSDLEAAFNQFTKPQANGIRWKRLKGNDLMKTVYQYSFRMFEEDQSFPLNLKELTTMFHLPVMATTAPELKEAKAGVAPAPLNIAGDGVVLGINDYHDKETMVRIGREDRARHFYVIGQTGTGKTSILKNMIVQDIRNGDGVCFIDPHGSDVQDILSLIPLERIDDVIYFDPANTARPMGLNMLEYDARYPEQKTFVVNEMMSIFNQLFDMKVGGGAMFEQYFRNAAALVMEDPASGSTLLEITRVLADKAFRDMKITKCKNPIIVQFWMSAEKTTGDQGLANFVPYISSKFDNFISNDIMRPIVLQQNSVLNFRKIMDEKKILLVNLSKGRLGDVNANLIGLVLVGKIAMAALSRVDMFGSGKQPNDFYLYIDEFQNVTTPSIATILSEARKYRLSLNIAHQYISQLSEEIRNAVFGNVGGIAAFRVGPEDAEFLESKFKPTFSAQDITKLDNYHAYMSMLIGGQPAKPFNIKTLPPENGDPSLAEKLKELSAWKYGAPREEVEAEIMARFRGNTRTDAD